MTSYVENEGQQSFSFDEEELLDRVMEAVLDAENCPYEATVNLLITDGAGIREYNKNYRDTDAETDVLSFPNLDFETPGDFSGVASCEADCFAPDSGELVLGYIILNAARVKSQAEEYGHSELREFAFLLAHSLFHLCGYDHMEKTEAAVMEEKQEAVLSGLGITREQGFRH
ncbi:MAG: rRNA maturation RNase YbeY [Lachnospiraceae bacterium]|nr:rRNA maturation RNase YbeY [Lachnospiraceae bacterium]